MRHTFLAVLAVAALASTALPQAHADPVHDAILCSANAVIGFSVAAVLACVQGLASTAPLCLQVYDAVSGTMRTFPCAPACAAPVVAAAVAINLQGAPGDAATGIATCGGVTEVTATATAGITGTGVGGQVGPLPNNGSTMACGLAAPPPATVVAYAVICLPGF